MRGPWKISVEVESGGEWCSWSAGGHIRLHMRCRDRSTRISEMEKEGVQTGILWGRMKDIMNPLVGAMNLPWRCDTLLRCVLMLLFKVLHSWSLLNRSFDQVIRTDDEDQPWTNLHWPEDKVTECALVSTTFLPVAYYSVVHVRGWKGWYFRTLWIMLGWGGKGLDSMTWVLLLFLCS